MNCFSAFGSLRPRWASSRSNVRAEPGDLPAEAPQHTPSPPGYDSMTSMSHHGMGCSCVADDGTKYSSVEEWERAVIGVSDPPRYSEGEKRQTYRPDVADAIDATVEQLDAELRELSLKIHDHPELGYQEKYAHQVLTEFMSNHGFKVTPHYLGLETAWRAEFSHDGKGTPRVIGFNSEMDALPGIGHACGHNLIAIAGVGAALGLAAAMKKHDLSGQIILLGTPAEEGGQGKVKLINSGGYKEMDVCMMAHPAPGAPHDVGTGPSLAIQALQVEFFGHTAHASASPWEGQNALDAAFLAYSAISVLRQQIKPTHRVHGIVEGRNWAPNVIPDYAKMRWLVRAPSWTEVEVLRERVKACFDAAALATACRMEYSVNPGTFDLRQNVALSDGYADVGSRRYGMNVLRGIAGAVGGSTDFGNVTYELPALHPCYSIPTKPDGGNHTASFAESAATKEAHKITLDVAKALGVLGSRILTDEQYLDEVKKTFKRGETTSEAQTKAIQQLQS